MNLQKKMKLYVHFNDMYLIFVGIGAILSIVFGSISVTSYRSDVNFSSWSWIVFWLSFISTVIIAFSLWTVMLLNLSKINFDNENLYESEVKFVKLLTILSIIFPYLLLVVARINATKILKQIN